MYSCSKPDRTRAMKLTEGYKKTNTLTVHEVCLASSYTTRQRRQRLIMTANDSVIKMFLAHTQKTKSSTPLNLRHVVLKTCSRSVSKQRAFMQPKLFIPRRSHRLASCVHARTDLRQTVASNQRLSRKTHNSASSGQDLLASVWIVQQTASHLLARLDCVHYSHTGTNTRLVLTKIILFF